MLADPDSLDQDSIEEPNYTYSKSTCDDRSGVFSGSQSSVYSSDVSRRYDDDDDRNEASGSYDDRTEYSLDDRDSTHASTKDSGSLTPLTHNTNAPRTPVAIGGFWSPFNYVKSAIDTYLSPQSDITQEGKGDGFESRRYRRSEPRTSRRSLERDRDAMNRTAHAVNTRNRDSSADSHREISRSSDRLGLSSGSSSFDENDTQFSVDTSRGSPKQQSRAHVYDRADRDVDEQQPEDESAAVVAPERLEDRFERENTTDSAADTTRSESGDFETFDDSHNVDTATRSTVDLADSDNFNSMTRTWSGTNSEDSNAYLNDVIGDSHSSDGVEIQLEDYENSAWNQQPSVDLEEGSESGPKLEPETVPEIDPDQKSTSGSEETEQVKHSGDQENSSKDDEYVYSNISADSGLVFSVSTDDTSALYRSLSPVIPVSPKEQPSVVNESSSSKSLNEDMQEDGESTKVDNDEEELDTHQDPGQVESSSSQPSVKSGTSQHNDPQVECSASQPSVESCTPKHQDPGQVENSTSQPAVESSASEDQDPGQVRSSTSQPSVESSASEDRDPGQVRSSTSQLSVESSAPESQDPGQVESSAPQPPTEMMHEVDGDHGTKVAAIRSENIAEVFRLVNELKEKKRMAAVAQAENDASSSAPIVESMEGDSSNGEHRAGEDTTDGDADGEAPRENDAVKAETNSLDEGMEKEINKDVKVSVSEEELNEIEVSHANVEEKEEADISKTEDIAFQPKDEDSTIFKYEEDGPVESRIEQEVYDPSQKKGADILKVTDIDREIAIADGDLSFVQDESFEAEVEQEVTSANAEESVKAITSDDLSFSQDGSFESGEIIPEDGKEARGGKLQGRFESVRAHEGSQVNGPPLDTEETTIERLQMQRGLPGGTQIEARQGSENLVKMAEDLAEAKAKAELSKLNTRLAAEKKERLKAVEEARRAAEEKAAALKREVEAQIQADQYAANLRAEEEAMKLKAEQEVFRLKTIEQARIAAERDAARAKEKEEARMAKIQAEEEMQAAKIEAAEEARLEKLKKEELARLAKLREEAARLKAEEEARTRIEELARLKAEEEARLEAEKEAEEEAIRLQAEEEAMQQKLREEEEARLKMIEENREVDARKRVEAFFDNYPAYLESEHNAIKGRNIVRDEQRRHMNRILSEDNPPWWTRLDSIANKSEQSAEKNATDRKAKWLLKQMQEAESLQVNPPSSKITVNKVEKAVNIYQKENKIWWEVKPRLEAKQPFHNRDWYNFANDQEGQMNVTKPEVGYIATLPPGRKRKMTSIASRTWFTMSEGDKVLATTEQPEEASLPKESEHVAETPEESAENDIAAVEAETEAEPVDETPQTIDDVIDYLKDNITSTLDGIASNGNFSNHRVSFTNPAPNVPLIGEPNNDDILLRNTIRHKPFGATYNAPTSQVKDLIEGAYSESITRRSNACGTLKLMSSQKKNVVSLGNTTGILDALVFVARQTPEGEDARVILTCRHRALTTIALLCQPKENRRLICEHRDVVPYLIEVIKDLEGETRLHACSAIAALAKTEENRSILMDADGLVTKLSDILVALKDETKKEAPDNESPADSKRRLTQQKVVNSTRLNACAALLHLSKQCSVSAAMCADEQALQNLALVASDLDDQVHTRCLETLCHLTRLPSNTEILGVSAETALALCKCAGSENSVDRVWALRAMQNITAHCSKKATFATKEMLAVLCESVEKLSAPVEHEAAISVIGNLCTDLATTILMVNTDKVVNVLINVGNNVEYSPEIQFVACDALATIAMWIQRVAQAGNVPQGCAFEPLPTFKSAGYMRYHTNEY